MKNIILILGITTILPFSTWGTDKSFMEENNDSFSQIISQNEKFDETPDQQELFKKILELAAVDDCDAINNIFNENPVILSDALKVWAAINKVRLFNEIPKEKYLSILEDGIKKTKSHSLKGLYYDAIGFCYTNGWGDIFDEDKAAQYWQKGAIFGCAQSYYQLGLYQLKKEDEKKDKDFVYLARLIKEDMEKIDTNASVEDYNLAIYSCLKMYTEDLKDENGEQFYTDPEKEVVHKVLNSLSEIKNKYKKISSIDLDYNDTGLDYNATSFDYISNNNMDISFSDNYFATDSNTKYKKAVIEKLECFSETGEYAQKKLKNIAEILLEKYATIDDRFACIINKFPKIAQKGFHESKWLEKFKTIDEKYEETITSMMDHIVEEMFKQCLPNYKQAIENILQANKLKFGHAQTYIEKHIISNLYDYYNLTSSIRYIKDEIMKFLASDQNQFINGIFKIQSFFDRNETIFKNVSVKGYEKKIRLDVKNRFLETLKLLHIFAKDFENIEVGKKAKDMLCYEVQAYSQNKLEVATNGCTDYSGPIEAAKFLLGLKIENTMVKVQDGLEEKEITIDIKKSLAKSYYNQALGFAHLAQDETDVYALKALEHEYEGASSLILTLANCYNNGGKYAKDSLGFFQQIPQKAFELYIKFIESPVEKSKEELTEALNGILKCLRFITLQTNGKEFVFEDDIDILKKNQKIVTSSKVEDYEYSDLNSEFNKLYGWGTYNTAINLISSKNEKQDFEKSKEFFNNFLKNYFLSKDKKEKAEKLVKIINGRKKAYREIIQDIQKDFEVKTTLEINKLELCATIAGELIKRMNKHDAFGGYYGRGIGKSNILAFNAKNENEIDLIFQLFYEDDMMKQQLMTEEVAIETRKLIFPRDSDDKDSSSDSDD